MQRYLTITFGMICLVCLAAAQSAGRALTLEQLLERYTQNYGGLRDANQLASISIEGVHIQNDEVYDFLLRKKRPAMMHYELRRNGTTLSTVYNGGIAWLQLSNAEERKIEELTGASLAAVKHEARFESPLFRHREKPEYIITLEGRELIGLLDTYVLLVREPGGANNRYFLHPENARVLRMDQLDTNGTLVMQTFYRDYRVVDGYPFAYEVENRFDGQTVAVTQVHSVLVNPGLLSIYFEKPRQ